MQKDRIPDLSLSALDALLSKKGSIVCRPEVSSSAYWDLMMNHWEITIKGIMSQTVIGLIEDNPDWASWAAQYIPDPLPWALSGRTLLPTLRMQIRELRRQVMSQSGPLEARAVISRFAASISTYTLASLDFVSFNGIESMRSHFEPIPVDPFGWQLGSLPGYLYRLSFESISQERSVEYLGKALAITSLMTAIGGRDGFAARFEAALKGSNLTEGWPAVKPYIAQLTSIVSPRAANLVFQILVHMSKRNPNDIRWRTGLVSHRVTAMTHVLYQRGFTQEEIEKKIEGLLRLEESRGKVGREELSK